VPATLADNEYPIMASVSSSASSHDMIFRSVEDLKKIATTMMIMKRCNDRHDRLWYAAYGGVDRLWTV